MPKNKPKKFNSFEELYDTIKESLIALDIIKSKKVNVSHLMNFTFIFHEDVSGVIEYNAGNFKKDHLTKEEYALLKKVLMNP